MGGHLPACGPAQHSSQGCRVSPEKEGLIPCRADIDGFICFVLQVKFPNTQGALMGSGVGDPERALLPFTSFSVSFTWGSQEPHLPQKPLLCTHNELTISWSLLGWVLGLWGQPGWGPDPTLLLSQSVPKAVAWRAEAHCLPQPSQLPPRALPVGLKEFYRS